MYQYIAKNHEDVLDLSGTVLPFLAIPFVRRERIKEHAIDHVEVLIEELVQLISSCFLCFALAPCAILTVGTTYQHKR